MIPIRYNTRNLLVRWKTTLLTAVGFTLVVALLVVMLAFVEGLNALAKKTGPQGNVIVLRDGANDELFSDIALDDKISELWNNHPEILLGYQVRLESVDTARKAEVVAVLRESAGLGPQRAESLVQ